MLWQSRESLIAAPVVPVLRFDAGTQEQIAIDRSLEPRLTTVEITPVVVYAAPLQSQRRVPELCMNATTSSHPRCVTLGGLA